MNQPFSLFIDHGPVAVTNYRGRLVEGKASASLIDTLPLVGEKQAVCVPRQALLSSSWPM
jgi:hypothetical protein